MEKIWVASLVPEMHSGQLEVFDNKSDALNFVQEMETSGKGKYKLMETPLNSRGDKIQGEPHWVDLAHLTAPCIECLLEDFSAVAGKPVDEQACTEFLEKHKDELQKKSDELVRDYLKKSISDYIDNERVVLG